MTLHGIRSMMDRREALQRLAGITGIAFGAVALSRSNAALAGTEVVGDFGFREEEQAQNAPTVEKLTDNIFMVAGVGGNIAVLIGKGDTLQIDAGNPGTTPAVQKAIQTVTPKPVTSLINTHWHFDHVGGNADTAKAGARILAHTNVRKRLSTDQEVEALGMKVPASPEIALPVLTFDNTLSLYQSGEELHLTHVAPAHTDTDITIHFRNANVLHTGDLFFNGFYPFIDYSSGGWIGGMVKAADRILAQVDDKTKIIPGHGPVGDKAQFRTYREMLATVQGRITPLVMAGKSVDEVVAAKPLADLDEKWGKGFMKPEVFVKVVYTGIKKNGAKTKA